MKLSDTEAYNLFKQKGLGQEKTPLNEIPQKSLQRMVDTGEITQEQADKALIEPGTTNKAFIEQLKSQGKVSDDPHVLSNMPVDLRSKVKQEAARMKVDLQSSASQKGGVIRDEYQSPNTGDILQGETTGRYGTSSNSPDWFRELGRNKDDVLKNLQKVVEDDPKNTLALRLIDKIVEEQTKGGFDSQAGAFPPDEEFKNLYEQYRAGKQAGEPINSPKPGEQGILLNEQAQYPRANEGIRSNVPPEKQIEGTMFEKPKTEETRLPFFSKEKVTVETDPTKVQEIRNSVVEGQNILRSGSFNGRKLSTQELWGVRKSVENSLARIGESKIADKPDQTIQDVTPKGYGPGELSASVIPGLSPAYAKVVGKRLQNIYQSLGAALKANPTKDILAAKRDAIDNIAANYGEQSGNYYRKTVPNVKDREALSFIVESGLDKSKLNSFKPGTLGTRYEGVIDYALNNFDRLQAKAQEIQKFFTDRVARENAHGVETGEIKDYVPHLWQDVEEINKPILGGAGKSGGASYYLKSRTFDTIADGLAAGLEPKTVDIADLAQNRVRGGEMKIAQKEYVKEMQSVIDPNTNQPIVKSPTVGANGREIAPRGYVPIDVFGNRIYVHQQYEGLMNALLAKDVVRNSTAGRALLEFTGGLKHSILLFDSFHASRIEQLAIAAKGSPGYKKGLSLIEHNDQTINHLEKTAEISPDEAQWVKANRGKFNEMVKMGLNMGQHSENLYQGFAKEIPGLKQFNKWVFEKLTRGAMAEVSLKFLERNENTLSKTLTHDEIVRKTAREANEYFANLGRQGIFKSQSLQSAARIAFLAPQWVEGLLRKEVRAGAQLGRVPYDIVKGNGLRIGNTARSLSTLVIGYMAANQIVNFATTGHSTFQNEDGHKFDAFIPGGKDGYWLSPLSVAAELSHDMIKYTQEANGDALKGMSRIGSNKLSPLSRAATMIASRQDYRGRELRSTKDVARAVGQTLLPVPLAAKGFTAGGDPERQLSASAGLKIEPNYKPFNGITHREIHSIESDMRSLPMKDRVKYFKEQTKEMPGRNKLKVLETLRREGVLP